MGNSTNDLQRFKINSDVGKLRLAAADIYAFNEKKMIIVIQTQEKIRKD